MTLYYGLYINERVQVGKNSSVIEINGNQYNAITGQLVGSAKKLATRAKQTSGFQSIDGFVRKSVAKVGPSSSSNQSTKTTKTSPSHGNDNTKPSAQSVHSGTQRTKTLMRSGLKKPTNKVTGQPTQIQKSKTGYSANIEPQRALKAKSTSQHTKVDRFGVPKAKVAPKPAQTAELVTRPVRANSSSSVTTLAMPSMITSASHQQLERLLDHALARADAHKQALRGRFPGQSRWQRLKLVPRWVSVGSVLLAVLLLGGFFAWQNVPQVSMKLAAAKAHINASVPAYSPSGFKFAGPISASNGAVTMRFTANGDASRSFSITQKSTQWDSSSLLANYIDPSHATFQTSQVKGTTIYIHGPSNDATWVNNGIWYTIQDKANLNSEQLLKIADSM
jgi:hypothetical protein